MEFWVQSLCSMPCLFQGIISLLLYVLQILQEALGRKRKRLFLSRMLGTEIGAATVFSVLLDTDNRVQVVFDQDVLAEEWYGCSDGTTTGYMKVRTAQIVNDFLPYAGHNTAVIHLESAETSGE